MSSQYRIDTTEMRFAIDFAKESGKLMREKFSLGIKAGWKADKTPVTEVDIEINRRFIEQVSQKFPGYSILGEEASQSTDKAEWAWVIDPLDGTVPFVLGMPLFTCCLALLHRGMPVLGVIYDPMLDRLFYAQKGCGAFMNGHKLAVNPAPTLKHGFLHFGSLRVNDRELLPMRERLLAKGCIPMPSSNIQYSLALNCAGTINGVVYMLSNFWDVAPGYAIGIEAGALVTDLHGQEQRYDQPTGGFILANPLVHKQLVEMVGQCLDQPIPK